MGPLHVNLAFRLIHEIHDVGTIEAVNRHAFAAGDVADDGFAANRVTTTGAVDQQVALSGHANGVVVLVAAKNSPHYAGEAAGFLCFFLGDRLASCRRQSPEDLPGRKFAVADARHQVVGAADAVIGGNLQ